MRWIALMGLLLAGCSALPARPDVSFYLNPDPMLIPQDPVARAGFRPIRPAPIPAPICLTENDHLALSAYLDAIDARR